jgi:hypothetical protein
VVKILEDLELNAISPHEALFTGSGNKPPGENPRMRARRTRNGLTAGKNVGKNAKLC